MPPRAAAGTVGLLTRKRGIVGAAVDRLGESGGELHVVVHACPEHAADVYRGRIEGVRMAWRLGEAATLANPRNPEAVSSSPA